MHAYNSSIPQSEPWRLWIRSESELHKETLFQNHTINKQYKIKKKEKGRGRRRESKGKDRLAMTTHIQESPRSSKYKITVMLQLQMLILSEFFTIFSSWHNYSSFQISSGIPVVISNS